MISRTKTVSYFIVFLFAMSAAWGQTTNQSGAVTGTITDQSGAAVPNAAITLTSQLGATTTKTTGNDGLFTFPLLPSGVYSLSVEASGFNKAIVNEIKVEVTVVRQVNVTLEIGQTTSAVEVNAVATQVNTTNSTLGNVLPGRTLEALPLATRNFTNLLALNANTSSSLPQAATAGRASSIVYVNGQRGTNNNLVINGIDSNNLGNNNFGAVPIPAPDTIEEFRVQTSLYDAAAGKTSGGNINVITKGGTPQFHGEVYEYFRNEAMNANEWFFNKTGQKQPVLRQNQFGGNFGGPVPLLKDTFFFGSYQGTYQTNGVSGAINTAFPVLPAVRSRANIEQAFGLTPGSLDPVALRLLNVPGQFNGFLIPSGVGAAPGQFGQLSVAKPLKYSEDQYNLNGDNTFGNSVRLGLRYFHANAVTFDPLGGQGTSSGTMNNLGSGETRPIVNHNGSVNLTWTISPNLVNEARVGFNRVYTAQIAPDPAKLSDIGMTRFNSSIFPGIPLFYTNDILPQFGGISTNNDQASYNNTLNYTDTLAWSLGKHTIRFGFEGRNYQINTFNNFASRGFLGYNLFTDFLTGNLLQEFVGTGQTYRDFRAHDLSGFVQDDFKLSSRLTLNLGVRYDYLSPSTDRRNRLGNFDPSRLDAQTLATGGPGLINGFILPENANFGTIKGTPGVSSSTFTIANNLNFAPRVGLAWDPIGDGKTSIRAGYGIYYVRISNQTLLGLITAAPFFSQSSVVNPGTTIGSTNANPFPNLPLPSQFPVFPSFPTFTGFNAAGSPVFTGGNLLALNPFQRNMRTPYAEQYNFSIQRELPGKWTGEIGYAGSQGVRLLQSLQLNQANLASPAAPIRGLTANSSRNVPARVPVVGFSSTGLNTVTANGHSSYNAFVSTLSRRMNNAFLQFAYTYSKSIDNNSGSATQDLGNSGGNQRFPQLQRGLSDFDRPHRFVATYSYDLPGPSQGIWKTLVGGWNVSGYTTLQSSLPINFTCACGTNNVGGYTTTLYPKLDGQIENIYNGNDWRAYTDPGTSAFRSGIVNTVPTLPSGSVLAGYYQPGYSAFNTPYPIGGVGPAANNSGQPFGNMGRNPNIRGPFQSQFDVSLMKTFKFGEKVGFQLRGDAYNVFNHPIFSLSNLAAATVGSPQFGRVSSTQTNARILNIAAKIIF
ncbi:MAG: carboxypeptidase regulatory-like domain-containing protein [Bryobacteraceae bacterium]